MKDNGIYGYIIPSEDEHQVGELRLSYGGERKPYQLLTSIARST